MIKNIIKSLLARRLGYRLSIKSNLAMSTLKSIGKNSALNNGVSCSAGVSIGRYTNISGPNTKLTARIHGISIGSFCSIAAGVLIQEYHHKYDLLSTSFVNKHLFGGSSDDDVVSKGKIVIEDDVWIGANAVILSGVTVGRGAIVGAGAVVTKDVQPYTIVGGNPAKFIKKRFDDDELIALIQSSNWWNWSDDEILKNQNLFGVESKELKQGLG